MTKVGLHAIGTSTTLESNKSHSRKSNFATEPTPVLYSTVTLPSLASGGAR